MSFHPPIAGLSNINPEHHSVAGDMENPKFKDNIPRFTQMHVRIDVETSFFALRSQSRNIDRYRNWTNRIVADMQDWWNPENVLPSGVKVYSTNPLQSSR
jgi:hypothetical protein